VVFVGRGLLHKPVLVRLFPVGGNMAIRPYKRDNLAIFLPLCFSLFRVPRFIGSGRLFFGGTPVPLPGRLFQNCPGWRKKDRK